MNIKIRAERKEDHKEVATLIREAFWDKFKPGCAEHLVAHNLRNVDAFIDELNFVALDGDKIVGQIMYSKAKIVADDGKIFDCIFVGPLGILPEYQGKGVGSILMRHTIEKAKSLGYNAILNYGHPGFYYRFGFANCEKFNIQTPWGANFDDFMALELYDGSLKNVYGKFFEDKAFHVTDQEIDEYEKNFPYKEKHILEGQLFK